MFSIQSILDLVQLSSTRTLEQLRPVLKDPASSGPPTVYEVFPSEGEWVNKTVVYPGKLGEEYTKTFGHYHPEGAPDEVYRVTEGEGILELQKKNLSEVLLVKAKSGDEIVITPEYGHSWSNISTTPLILVDNWEIGHTRADYGPIERIGGMAYYLVELNGEPQAVPNANYKNLPEPVFLTAEEFRRR